jgi:hypothetical protein
MNCSQPEITEQASRHSQVAVSLIAAETTNISGVTEHPLLNAQEFEEEMNRRAGVITDVLARIMEQPAALRHWGLNE